jgi:predicted HNH restriction endonuclease
MDLPDISKHRMNPGQMASAASVKLRNLAANTTGATRQRLEALAAHAEFQKAVRYFATHERRSKRPKGDSESQIMRTAESDVRAMLKSKPSRIDSQPNASRAHKASRSGEGRNRVAPEKNFFGELTSTRSITEGAVKKVLVNRYERDPLARTRAIAIHGTKCKVCMFDFVMHYGEIGDGFIHIHHLNPLSLQKKSYQPDPIKDLVPVCPNCHAMLHSSDPPYSIEALQAIWERYNKMDE